jgi:hypothetical protein
MKLQISKKENAKEKKKLFKRKQHLQFVDTINYWK